MSFRMKYDASNVQFDPLHNICCVYDEKLPKMAVFKEIQEFIKRLPIQKVLMNQHNVFRSHIERFWKNTKYDEENKVITSIVSLNSQEKEIVISEQLVREVLDLPDDEDSPTKFPERMVKGCMLRMGYNGPLNSANYLKSCFSKPYKFFIHSIVHALSHRKGGYDVMRDYQMNMVTALVLNKKYHKNHPESTTKAEFFGFIKSADYQDPDPVDHLKWRNEEEIKEKNAVDDLKILVGFKATRNEWFTKEEKKKRSRKTTPKVQIEEGSSSQPKKKRQKKVVETLLVDEPEEEEPEADGEGDNVRLSPESEQILKSLKESFAAGENEGDNEEKSSSSSSESEIDETGRLKRIKADIEKEKLKRKRREEKDDDLYIPSPDHVQDTQTPPSSGGRKKASARKRIVSPKVRKLTIKMDPKRTSKPKQPTPPEPQQPPSPPYLSPPHESPPKQTSPPTHQSPPHQSPPHQ
ncbi:hypothetical protein HanXRQr2_Chr03g0101991 [Helianthus annuus]|uniref:Uncharacterized protein n=1 Tax=Helianthus annuus TaxID=4232 RepID=A0A9K3JDN5_HELAN|nr:hypothetical protein HanXRQr2_Chr03g0101991 [Helianthus annuus]